MDKHNWSMNCHKGSHKLCRGRRGRHGKGRPGPEKCECTVCNHAIITDQICANVGCDKTIPAYFLKNNQRKARFCSRCRSNAGVFNYKPLAWRCKLCDIIMDRIEYPFYNYYCKKHPHSH